jgi:hypothetical protein
MRKKIYIKDTREFVGTDKWEPWEFMHEESGLSDVWKQMFPPYTTLTIDYEHTGKFYNMGITKDIEDGEPLKWIPTHKFR